MTVASHHALLVGNSRFPKAKELPSLAGPVNDLPLLRETLAHEQIGLFRSENIVLVPERPVQELRVEIARFFTQSGPDDVLMFYYTGHGFRSLENRLYLCANDTELELLTATALPADEISDFMDAAPANTIIAVLDCCHSGVATKSATNPAQYVEQFGGEGRFVIAASAAEQLAQDADGVTGASPFTAVLIEALRSAPLATDAKGYVSLDSVYAYVHEVVKKEHGHEPQRKFSGAGAVPVARREVKPTAQREVGLIGPGREERPFRTWIQISVGRLISRVFPRAALPMLGKAYESLIKSSLNNRTIRGIRAYAAGLERVIDNERNAGKDFSQRVRRRKEVLYQGVAVAGILGDHEAAAEFESSLAELEPPEFDPT